MDGSIVVVGTLTRCALLKSPCDLKTSQINMQWSIIQDLMLYEFELGHYTAEVGAVEYTDCTSAEG